MLSLASLGLPDIKEFGLEPGAICLLAACVRGTVPSRLTASVATQIDLSCCVAAPMSRGYQTH